MRTLINWSVGAVCATVIVTGLSALPSQSQDVKSDRRELRQDTQEIRHDRKNLEAARQQLRDAYRSGDPAAIKAARETFQKHRVELRGDLKDRRQDVVK